MLVIKDGDMNREKYKELLRDKAIQKNIIVNAIVLVVLICEFVAFQYTFLKGLRYLIIIEALFVIAWKDKREKIILNKHLIVLIGIRVLILICECISYPVYGKSIFASSVMGMFIGFLVFGICYFVSRGGMGAGDVKLISVLGLYIGSADIMLVLILIASSSALFSVISLMRKKTNLKEEIPFAPFVLVGTIAAMMLGI